MRKRGNLWGLLLALLIGCSACFLYKQNERANYAPMYSKTGLSQQLKMNVWHSALEQSQVCVQLPRSARLKGEYVLKSDWKNLYTQQIDTLQTYLDYQQIKSIPHCFDLPLIDSVQYDLRIRCYPIANKKVVYQTQAFVDKSAAFTRQDILVKKGRKVLFNSYIARKDSIYFIDKNGLLPKVEMAFTEWGWDLPLPPFSEKIKPQKPLTFQMVSNPYYLDSLGQYVFKIPTDSLYQHIPVNLVADDFPKLTSAQNLIYPLRYICRKEEFEQLKTYNNPKAAIDSFWLDKAKSFERAKVLIKEYYGRVERTNELFTQEKIGWQSDKGMIYIIFGQPDLVVQKKEEEIWTYYSMLASNPELQFYFEKQSDGSEKMFRSWQYREPWDEAVYLWRNGIIAKQSK